VSRSERQGWWATKIRQFRSHVGARVPDEERRALAAWITPTQLALFDTMHVADRRHGLDVATTLRAEGVTDPEVLLAGLLHDAGKGDVGIWPRVAYSIGQTYGPIPVRVARLVPGFGPALDRLATHADTSAALAAEAGCSVRTIELIRWQDAPHDPVAGELLRLADEAN
jgi:hypothetical protein